MFTVLYFAYVFMLSLVLLLFFYIIYICHNLFKEIVQIYYVWLLTYVYCRSVDECHIVNLMIDIITYVVYVSIV